MPLTFVSVRSVQHHAVSICCGAWLHRMAREEPSAKSAPSLLLALPDPCLLAVLQCCAADGQRSLFSAARAHSRLHQAAVLALSSLSMHCKVQQQADSILMLLGKHGKQIGSVQLTTDDIYDYHVSILELPPSLQPSRLKLTGFGLQLQPGNGFRGVLGVAAQVAALRQLELKLFDLLEGDEELAAALTQLPTGLEHLCIASEDEGLYTHLSISALQHLQQLTFLKLANISVVDNHKVGPTLQSMTRLVDLRFHYVYAEDGDRSSVLTAGVLSGMSHLTRLGLFGTVKPGVVASQTQLHHLEMQECLWSRQQSGSYYAPGHSNAILELQQLQQLTHLSVSCASRIGYWWIDFPAATVSALTVSSNLQHLGISGALPVGTWQVLFPAGRQLPNLRVLDISGAYEKSRCEDVPTSRLDCSLLIACCPGLLSVGGLRWETIWEDMGRFVARSLNTNTQVVEHTLKTARQQAAMRTETYQVAAQVRPVGFAGGLCVL
jgi:hypothetical protein